MKDNDFENLRCFKRMLVKELDDYNVSKLIDVLSNVDNLSITLTVGELQDILIKTDTLRENNSNLISFKHFFKLILKLIDLYMMKLCQQ